MRKAFVKSLYEAALADEKILLITGDLGFGVLDIFEKNLPNQFINAGIAEQSMMSLAAGYASTGHRVFVYSIGNFPTIRCLEQIRNDVCFMENNVTIVAVGAGYSYGSQGYSHHALEDISIMRSLPNMKIMIPMDPQDAVDSTSYILSQEGPSYLRIGKDGEPNFESRIERCSINKFKEIRNGSHGTILFTGSIGKNVVRAAESLLAMGIEVSVAGCTNLSFLDSEYLEQAAAKGPILTVEEHATPGGFGSLILEYFAVNGEFPKINILGAARNNLKNIGSQEHLLELNGLSSENIKIQFAALL